MDWFVAIISIVAATALGWFLRGAGDLIERTRLLHNAYERGVADGEDQEKARWAQGVFCGKPKGQCRGLGSRIQGHRCPHCHALLIR